MRFLQTWLQNSHPVVIKSEYKTSFWEEVFMSLQLIVGGSGTGKSHLAYTKILEEAACFPEKRYYILVPEQFTMRTQKTVVEMSPSGGILNIDVLSFLRLSYRVFEETGGDDLDLLSDMGKTMVLRKIGARLKDTLPYLGSQMEKPGILDEVKSLISELMQYDIRPEELKEMLEKVPEDSLLSYKLRDVEKLYAAFCAFLSGHYMTGEETMDRLAEVLPSSERIRHSVILLDGFTGFTPVQLNVLEVLLGMADKVYVTVTMNAEEMGSLKGGSLLFKMSRDMIWSLRKIAKEEEEPILLFHSSRTRFGRSDSLKYLEENLFRYRGCPPYQKKPEEIDLFCAGSPVQEMEEVVRRIARLVRKENLKYGQIAVITGNMEEYSSVARNIFLKAGIPVFIDETHSVLMNPFVEFIRSSLHMVKTGFSYQGVFRYLRCDLSDIGRDEADLLENYVKAAGITSFSRWDEEWTYLLRGQTEEELADLNRLRMKFLDEVRDFRLGLLGGGKTVLDYCRTIYGFIIKCHIYEKLKAQEEEFHRQQNAAMEKEYHQIYGIIVHILDEMASILGNEPISREGFLEILDTGLAKAKVALIPPGQDQVLVGDMERTRLKDVKALFFVGVNEGNIPRAASGSGLLGDMDREFFTKEGIHLAPDSREQMAMQRFYLYLNLTKPSDHLILSWSLSDNQGNARMSAFLVGTIEKMFPEITVCLPGKEEGFRAETPDAGIYEMLRRLEKFETNHPDPVLLELYRWYQNMPAYRPVVRDLLDDALYKKPVDEISKAVAAALYGKVMEGGATRLERFASCAYAHYLRYGLKLTERLEFEFKAMDLGNIMHDALEKFAWEVQERNLSWKVMTDSQRDSLADECLEKAVEGMRILHSSARNAYQKIRAGRLLKRTAWALQQQLKNGEFRPEGFEVSLSGGRIDRMDVLEEKGYVYVNVMDYKTGSTTFDMSRIYHGLQLQLAIYLEGALRTEQKKHPDKIIVPAGIFYCHIRDPLIEESMSISDEKVKEKLISRLKLNGLVKDDPVIVRKMDSTTATLPVRFKKDGTFYADSSVASQEQFKILEEFVRNKVENLKQKILEGDAALSPFKMDDLTACTYCPYSESCGFDRRLPGCTFRTLEKTDRNEIWKQMEDEVHGS